MLIYNLVHYCKSSGVITYERRYGSDEEQTRTAAVDVAEQKFHTPMFQQNEREREMRKNK